MVDTCRAFVHILDALLIERIARPGVRSQVPCIGTRVKLEQLKTQRAKLRCRNLIIYICHFGLRIHQLRCNRAEVALQKRWVRHCCRSDYWLRQAQAFIAQKEKGAVFDNRTTNCATKLVPAEGCRRTRKGEVVFCVKLRVPKKLEQIPMKPVAACLCDHHDLAARCTSILCRINASEKLGLLDAFYRRPEGRRHDVLVVIVDTVDGKSIRRLIVTRYVEPAAKPKG